ncbi:MAG: hypothetical protein QW512_06225, partial [Thermofilaceae archaeon]
MSKQRILMGVLAALVVVAGVLGYFIGTMQQPASQPPYQPTTQPETQTPSTPAAWQPPEKIKAAWIYVGPVGDLGWSYMHDIGRKYVQTLFKDWLETTYVEAVAEERLLEVI